MNNLASKEEIDVNFPNWLKEKKEFALENFQKLSTSKEKFKDVIESMEFDNLENKYDFGNIESNWNNKYKFIFGCNSLKIDDGIIIKSLKDAINENEDLIKPYLVKEIFNSTDSRFTFLAEALYRDGVFIYIPKDSYIELPIHLLKSVINGKSQNYYKTVIIIEKGSKLTIIDELKSRNTKDFYLVSGINDIYLKDNAQLNYLHLQNFDYNAFNFSLQRVNLSKDSKLNLFSLSLGSQFSYENIRVYSNNTGSKSNILGLVLGNKEQVFQHQTLQDHLSGYSESNLHFEVILNDKSESSHNGFVHIEKQAIQTSAHQLIKNLLLSRKAKAEAIPNLEILADDVSCSHGVSLGPVNTEELFYIMSRGFPIKEAENLIIEGNIENVISKIENTEISEKLREYILSSLKEK
jgi:Fe-S cluster assembly protein SufD